MDDDRDIEDITPFGDEWDKLLSEATTRRESQRGEQIRGSRLKNSLTSVFSIGPKTRIGVQLGTLCTIAGALVMATVFLYGMKVNSDRALRQFTRLSEDFSAFRNELKPVLKEHQELWIDYKNRKEQR